MKKYTLKKSRNFYFSVQNTQTYTYVEKQCLKSTRNNVAMKLIILFFFCAKKEYVLSPASQQQCIEVTGELFTLKANDLFCDKCYYFTLGWKLKEQYNLILNLSIQVQCIIKLANLTHSKSLQSICKRRLCTIFGHFQPIVYFFG